MVEQEEQEEQELEEQEEQEQCEKDLLLQLRAVLTIFWLADGTAPHGRPRAAGRLGRKDLNTMHHDTPQTYDV